MSIRCGDHRHETVAQVRACQLDGKPVRPLWFHLRGRPFSSQERSPSGQYAGEAASRIRRQAVDTRYGHDYDSGREDDWKPDRYQGLSAYRYNPATPPMVKYVRDLLDDRVVPEEVSAGYRKEIAADSLTFDAARQFIEAYKDAPKKALRPGKAETSIEPMPEVDAGHYAIDVDGTLKFYVVDRPTEGRWAGYLFLAVQASDEKHPIKNRETKRAILARIAENPMEAMLRYGKEIGRCGHCRRTLTDEESRARGIGPVCAGKLGF